MRSLLRLALTSLSCVCVQALLQDWTGSCRLLLSDSELGAYDEPDQFLMLSMLLSCARHAAGQCLMDPSAALWEEPAPSKPLAAMTAALLPHLPALLVRFSSDAQKVRAGACGLLTLRLSCYIRRMWPWSCWDSGHGWSLWSRP